MTSTNVQLKNKTIKRTREGRWEDLTLSVRAVPPPAGSAATKMAWLNSVVQKCIADGYRVVVQSSLDPVTGLNSVMFNYSYSDCNYPATISAGYARSKQGAKILVTDSLLSIYSFDPSDQTFEPLSRAGDSVAIGEPTAEKMPRENEHIQDTTVLSLTNPQATQAVAPIPSDIGFSTVFSASTPEHSHQDLTEREFYYGTVEFSSTDTFGQILPITRGAPSEYAQGIRIPSDLQNVDGTVAGVPFHVYVMCRPTAEFIVKVNPAPNQAGLYALTSIPNFDMVDSDVQVQWLHPNLIYQRGGLENPAINLGTQNDARLEVPYNMPSNYIVTEGSENPLSALTTSALFSVVCISPLATGDSSEQTLQATVWYRFRNLKFNAMRYTKDPTATLYRAGDAEPMSRAGGGMSTAVGHVWNFVESIPIVGSIADTLGNVLGEFAVGADRLILGDEHADDFAERLESIGMISGKEKDKGKGGNLLPKPGKTKSAVPTLKALRSPTKPKTAILPASNMCFANVADAEHAHRLGAHSAVQTLDMVGIAPSVQDMVQRPNLLKPITITTDMDRGTILTRLSLGPLNTTDHYNPGSYSSFHAGPLAYACGCFAYYSGKKIYVFQLVKTAFHKCSITIAGTPYAEVPNNVEAGSQYFKLLDFNDLAVASYDCPYCDPYHTRRSPLSTILCDQRPGQAAAAGQHYFETSVPFVGEIAVILSNPLVITATSAAPLVAPSIQMLIFEYMDEGAQFDMPTDPKIEMFMMNGVLPPEPNDLVLERAGDPIFPGAEAETVPEEERDFGRMASLGLALRTCDSSSNLLAIMRRYTMNFRLQFTNQYFFPLTPRALTKVTNLSFTGGGTDIPSWTWAWVHAFAYYYGGMDFMANIIGLTAEERSHPVQVAVTPPDIIARGEFGFGMTGGATDVTKISNNGPYSTVWHPTVNPMQEISTAQYVKANKVFLHGTTTVDRQRTYPDDNSVKSNGTLVFTNISEEATPQNLQLWAKVGADFRVDTFMGFFPVKFTRQEAPPLVRDLVVDGSVTEFRRLNPQVMRRIMGKSESWLRYRYREPTHLSPPRPLLIHTNDVTTITDNTIFTDRYDILTDHFSGNNRASDAIQLLREGIEPNPGPVCSRPYALHFRSTIARDLRSKQLMSPAGDSETRFQKISKSVKNAAAYVVSPVTVPLNNVSVRVDEMAGGVTTASGAVARVASRADGILENVQETVASLFETVKGTLGSIPDPSSLWNALLHFVHAFINPTKGTCAVAFVGIFSSLGLIPVSLMATASELFGKLLKFVWNGPQEVHNGPGEMARADDPDSDAWVEVGSLAVSCICNLIGHKVKSGDKFTVTKGLFSTAGATFSMTTHVARFLKNTLHLFKRAFRWVLSKIPGITEFEYAAENPELIKNFVGEATEMLNPLNTPLITTSPAHRARFWATVVTAYYLRKVMATANTVKFPPTLQKMVLDVVRLGEKLSMQLTSCPVRYEPFVCYMVGESAIGKSFIANQVIVEILDKIGYRGYDNPVFTRTPGNEFWNGATAQPAVLYDDFCAVGGEFSDMQIQELFALKTTANFNPPQAELEEKKFRFNPLLVWMASNIPYPKIAGVKSHTAVWRRRDVLIHAKKKEEYKDTKVANIPEEITKVFGHLQFAFYPDPSIPTDVKDLTEWVDYDEMKTRLETMHAEYHETEKKHVRLRLDQLQRLLPDSASRVPEGVDPFTIFYESQILAAEASPRQTGLLPSELVEFTLLHRADVVSAAQKTAAAVKKFVQAARNKVSEIDIMLYAADYEPGPQNEPFDRDNITSHEYDNMSLDQQARIDALDIAAAPPVSITTQIHAGVRQYDNLFTQRAQESRAMRPTGIFSVMAQGTNYLMSKVNHFVYRKTGDIMIDVLGNPEYVNHMIRCNVCHERKICTYRCSNPVLHPICQLCFANLEDQLCPLRCGHALSPWIKDSFSLSTHQKVMMWACIAAQYGTVLSQRFWNLVARYGNAMDVISIVASVMYSAYMPLREVRQSTESLTTYVDAYNAEYGTDYVVFPVYAGENTRYYAMSSTNPVNTMVLSGDALSLPPNRYPQLTPTQYTSTFRTRLPAEDHLILNTQVSSVETAAAARQVLQNMRSMNRAGDEEEEFHDVVPSTSEGTPNHSAQGVTYDNRGGTTFVCEYTLSSTVLEQGTEESPEGCIHRQLTPSWDYVKMGSNSGQWMDPHDNTIYVEDVRCPVSCLFDEVASRRHFLHRWASKHYYDVHLLVKEKCWEKDKSSTAPLDFLGDQPKPASWLTSFLSKFSAKKWWEWLGMKIGKVGRILMLAAATIGLLAGANALFGMTRMSAAGYSSGRTVVASHPRAALNPKVMSYSGGPVSEFDMKVGKLWANTVWLTCKRVTCNEVYCVKALMVRDRWCMLTKHQLDSLCEEEKKGATVYFNSTRDSSQRPCPLVKSPKMHLEGYDLATVRLSPSTTGAYKSITQFAHKTTDITLARTTAYVMEPNFECAAYGMFSVVLEPGKAPKGSCSKLDDELTRSYIYKGFSGKNTCGSLLLFPDNNTPLAGFHYVAQKASHHGMGGAVPLNAEILCMLSPNSVVDVAEVEQLEPIKENPMVMSLSGDYIMEGHIQSRYVPFQNHKTSITPSLVSSTLEEVGVEVKTAPACLTGRDPRWVHDKTPLISGCDKHCIPHADFPRAVEDVVADAAFADFKVKAKPLINVVCVRSTKAAVCGIEGIDQFPPIDMQTSVGWPLNTWKINKKGATRESLLNPIRDVQGRMYDISLNPDFEKYMQSRLAMREQGIVPPTVFWDHLKDERRKPAKLSALGGTRIFSLSPLDFLLHHRQYYMDFTAAWHANWFDLEHAVGIAVDGPDWSILANSLLSIGTKIVCIDYSNFGPSLNARLASQIWDKIDAWYFHHGVQDDAQVRIVMKNEVIQPLHLCQDLLYRTYAGIPSGHPATTLLNTEVNKAQLKICWLHLAPSEYKTLEAFKENVRLFAYGDDGIFSVSDEVAQWFNGITIAEWFSKFGVRVTPASKDDTVLPYMPITQATFLKRGFLKHPKRPNQWLAPLAKDSITDCAHWISMKNQALSGTQVNLDQSLRLAFGHGPEFFNQWRDTLNDAVASCGRGLQPLYLDWDMLDDQFFN